MSSRLACGSVEFFRHCERSAMKPAPFHYARPDSLAEACTLLAADEDARAIAGGQTLIPMMAMRLARPTKLVDICRLPELYGISSGDDSVTIRAATRQVEAEHSAIVRGLAPLLAKALPWVGHPPTRNRGTIGGSIANADPSAEIPLVAVTLGASIEVASTGGATTHAADGFFIGPMLTALAQGDCVRAVHFPRWRHARVGTAFHEVSARRSDFAFVAAAAQVASDEAGRIVEVALGIGGVGDYPVRIDTTALIGQRPEQRICEEVVRAGTRALEATSDLHASAAYRQRVAAVLGVQALVDACADCGLHTPARGEA
jgi:CO/xanthine dehydrogenase FAD-binding subunit